MLAPIVLFVYNRPWHTRQTLESLMENVLANQSSLFIYADGPKDNSEIEKTKIRKVRELIKETHWCKEVSIIESSINKGLANSIIDGVTEIVNEYGKVIVLEDDMISSKYFLDFLNTALDTYEHEEDVASISGYAPSITMSCNYFIKGTQVWGWATWKRAWRLFEPDGKTLLQELLAKNLSYKFDKDGTDIQTAILRDQVSGKNDSWGIRWHASVFLKNKLNLYPSTSLIKNVGFDGSGTHCKQISEPRGDTSDKSIPVDEIEIKESKEALRKIIWSVRVKILKGKIKQAMALLGLS